MKCCNKEMVVFAGAVRECKKCGNLKFDEDLDKENRKQEAILRKAGEKK